MDDSNISVLRLLAPSKIAFYKVNWSKMRLSARGPGLKALSWYEVIRTCYWK